MSEPTTAGAQGGETRLMRSPFVFLLNAFEAASQADRPADHGYGAKREAVLAYVAKLEARVRELEAASVDGWTEPTREEVERLADDLGCSTAPIKNQAAWMLRELRRQRDKARDEVEAVWAVMPKGSEFLDPPDGGDVPLHEQVRRVVEALTEARSVEPAARLSAGGDRTPAPITDDEINELHAACTTHDASDQGPTSVMLAKLVDAARAGGDRREPEGGTPLERIAKLPRYSPSVAYESGGPAEYAGMEEDIDGGWLDRDEALGAAASPSVEPGDRERGRLRATIDAVLHQIEYGPASHGDRRDLKWCATQLRAALSRPESDHAE